MDEKPRTTPYPLRMHDDLRAKLEESAKAGSRSLHAEIVARLEASFTRPSGTGEPNDAYAQERGFWPTEMIEEVAQRAAEAAANKVLSVQAHGFQSGKFGTANVQTEIQKKPSDN